MPSNAFWGANPSCRNYFISGFDPRGSNHYQKLFQIELKERGWALGKRISNGNITRWPLDLKQDQGNNDFKRSTSELCFLHWDDIARENWPRKPLELLKQCSHYAYFFLAKGCFIHLAKLCPGVALCGAYPLLFIFFSLVLAIVTSGLSFMGLSVVTAFFEFKLISCLLVALITLWKAWNMAERLGVIWLTRSILFTHQLGQARDSALRNKVKTLADEVLILEQQCPAKAIRLIGHSSGSFVLAMVAAELHRHPKSKSLLGRLELLTLGQNLANLSLYPGAHEFRKDLEELATEPILPWRDVTSYQDLLCFAGVNPYESCGLHGPKGQSYPKMELINLAMARGFRHRHELLSHQFDIHFDYLRNTCSRVDLTRLFVGDSQRNSNE